PRAAFPVLGELVDRRRDREARLAGGHGRQALSLANGIGEILVVPVFQARLVVEHVLLRRTAEHMQVDGALGLGREVGETGQSTAVGLKERPERRDAQSAGAASEKLATGFGQYRRHLFNVSSRLKS